VPSPFPWAVNEYVAARRLGLSVDTLRRDRRLGHLGIPFIKIGSGKHGTVRYDLADLDAFREARKRPPPPQAPQALPVAAEPADEAAMQPEAPAEPPGPRRPSHPRTPWEALAETVLAETEEEPFASGVVTRSHRPGGYFGG